MARLPFGRSKALDWLGLFRSSLRVARGAPSAGKALATYRSCLMPRTRWCRPSASGIISCGKTVTAARPGEKSVHRRVGGRHGDRRFRKSAGASAHPRRIADVSRRLELPSNGCNHRPWILLVVSVGPATSGNRSAAGFHANGRHPARRRSAGRRPSASTTEEIGATPCPEFGRNTPAKQLSPVAKRQQKVVHGASHGFTTIAIQ